MPTKKREKGEKEKMTNTVFKGNIGHGRIKFTKTVSETIRNFLQERVLAPEILETEKGFIVCVRWKEPAKEKIHSLRGAFGDGPEYVDKEVNELRGVNIRFSDEDGFIVMYWGSNLCQSVFGIPIGELCKPVFFKLDEDKIILSPVRSTIEDKKEKTILTIQKTEVPIINETFKGFLPFPPKNHWDLLCWTVELKDFLPFKCLTIAQNQYPDLIGISLDGKMIKAELELDSKHFDHWEELKRGNLVDYVICWRVTDSLSQKLPKEIKVIELYDFARERMRTGDWL